MHYPADLRMAGSKNRDKACPSLRRVTRDPVWMELYGPDEVVTPPAAPDVDFEDDDFEARWWPGRGDD
jgi:hypothetical protein